MLKVHSKFGCSSDTSKISGNFTNNAFGKHQNIFSLSYDAEIFANITTVHKGAIHISIYIT